jgi:protein-S-isoprenylcysteine O-methyltransferase Ste14
MVGVLQSIPAKLRQIIYGAFVTIGVLLGAIQVGNASINNGSQPDWLTAALVVYAYLGTALGFTAAVNVTSESLPRPAPDNPRHHDERGRVRDPLSIVIVGTCVLFLLILVSILVHSA